MAKVHNVQRGIFRGTGECPHWDDKTQTLHFIEIPVSSPHGRVFQWKPTSPASELKEFEFKNKCISFVCPTKQTKYLLGANQEIIEFDWKTKTHKVVHQVDQGKVTRLNDAKCVPGGHLVCGTMPVRKSTSDPWEEGIGSMYGVDTSNTLKVLDTGFTISNGVTWTNDTKTIFFTDSLPRKVYAYDYDSAAFSISNKRTAIDFGKYPVADMGAPDGCCVDTKGRMWIACFNAGKVVCVDITTEQILKEIVFPTKVVTSLCFGGANLDELYVTSSKFGLTEEQLATTEREAGSLFKVTGLDDAKGEPMIEYGA